MKNPLIAISMGDFNGIGPEIVLKAFNNIDRSRSTPLIVGSKLVFDYYREILQTGSPLKTLDNVSDITHDEDLLCLLEINTPSSLKPEPGVISPVAGRASMLAVKAAAELCMESLASAMVTAPISKEAIHLGGFSFPGHTEYLAELTGTDHFQMMLLHQNLRVALVTIHIPLSKVASHIRYSGILHNIRLLNRSLINNFSIETPRIAVLGLNPHAGDGGVLGEEEKTIIGPAIEDSRRTSINVEGPFAADSFFGTRSHEKYDAVLAMYHDQGLIPFKTLSFGSGVNFTAGLPIIRTSPDHGTGFDIAGTNKASPDSFIAAYNLAAELALNRINRR